MMMPPPANTSSSSASVEVSQGLDNGDLQCDSTLEGVLEAVMTPLPINALGPVGIVNMIAPLPVMMTALFEGPA